MCQESSDASGLVTRREGCLLLSARSLLAQRGKFTHSVSIRTYLSLLVAIRHAILMLTMVPVAVCLRHHWLQPQPEPVLRLLPTTTREPDAAGRHLTTARRWWPWAPWSWTVPRPYPMEQLTQYRRRLPCRSSHPQSCGVLGRRSRLSLHLPPLPLLCLLARECRP